MIANPSSLPVETGPAVGPDVILGLFFQGRTRAEILAEHPSLTDADVDAALVSPGVTNRRPEVAIDGRRMTLDELAVVRLPEELQARMRAMIGREKRGRPLPGEKEILDDYCALIHVMTMALGMAILELRAKGT